MASTDIAYIRIHPGMGIARLGNSDTHFVGPEAPGVVPDPGGTGGPGPDGGTFKDDQGRMKRQAQRFRIYAYNANDEVITELNSTNSEVLDIRWHVHVRNMKAANYAFQGAYLYDPQDLRNPSIQPDLAPIQRDQLIIDPGPQDISISVPAPVDMSGRIFDNVGPNGDGTGLTLPGYLKFDPDPMTPPDQEVPVTYQGASVSLGQLQLDDVGRLLFVPARVSPAV